MLVNLEKLGCSDTPECSVLVNLAKLGCSDTPECSVLVNLEKLGCSEAVNLELSETPGCSELVNSELSVTSSAEVNLEALVIFLRIIDEQLTATSDT